MSVNSKKSHPKPQWKWKKYSFCAFVISIAIYLFICSKALHFTIKEESEQYSTEDQENRVYESICESGEESKEKIAYLCRGNFIKDATKLLLNGGNVDVVQIGAHVGISEHDPIAGTLIKLLDEVISASNKNEHQGNELRNKFHWTFVEPSPPNFKRHSENLLKHKHLCDMKSINVAVVSDLTENRDEMTFYSIRDTIDPETGYDSLSGKTLPNYVSQLSSFEKGPIYFNRNVFRKNGLNVEDYIVETKVTIESYSDVMEQAADGRKENPLLVLIDTEGFDCTIVEGISPSSPYLPEYLIFEHKQCEKENALKHLDNMGYSYTITSDDAIAIKKVLE